MTTRMELDRETAAELQELRELKKKYKRIQLEHEIPHFSPHRATGP